MNEQVKSYKDLLVWQKGITLVEWIYRITREFPQSEEYGLKSQMRRAAVSIPSNVAEGSVRHSSAEYTRYISIALGSVAELDTQVELAKRLGFVQEVEAGSLVESCQELGRMLNGLRRSITNHRLPRSPAT